LHYFCFRQPLPFNVLSFSPLVSIPIRKTIAGGLQENGTQKGRPPKYQVTNPHMQTMAKEGQAQQFMVNALAGQYDKKRHVSPSEMAAILTNRLDACFFPSSEGTNMTVMYIVMLNPNTGRK
jgi:hypothetical protein